MPALISATSQKTGNGYIFVQMIPMDACRTEFVIFKIGLACRQEAREPGEGHPKDTPIA